MAYAQDAARTEQQARSRRAGRLPARIDTLIAYLVFASSVVFAAAVVLKLIP